MSENRVIGIENRLPWKLPADMKWFRKHTLGKPVILGRKTFDSFGGKPLPERKNIIITHNRSYSTENAIVAYSLDEAIDIAGDADEAMIIGGANIYAQALPIAQRLYVTIVHTKVKGDAWFPDFDMSEWKLTQLTKHKADDKNVHACTFKIFDRQEKS